MNQGGKKYLDWNDSDGLVVALRNNTMKRTDLMGSQDDE
jgi:hypothetical protein